MIGLRRAINGSIAGLFAEGETRHFAPSADDPGLVPADSPARVVHRDPSGLIAGVRALLFQTLHPDACYAVHQHSVYDHDPVGRLRRTAHFLGATILGTGTEAAAAIAVVNAIHSRIAGTLPDGRPYRADDPHLIRWVHVTEVDSFLDAFERYGHRRLSDDETDRYVADMAPIGEALGGSDLPRTRAELADALESYRAELAASPECRDITRFIFAPQLPLSALAMYPIVFSAAAASLPGWARRMLLLPLAPGVDPLLIRPAATVLTRTLRFAHPSPPTGT